MVTLLDGRAYATALEPGTLAHAEAVQAARGRSPLLTLITASDDPAQGSYVALKEKAAGRVGVEARHVSLGGGATADEIVDAVRRAGTDAEVDGVFVQFPLDGIPSPEIGQLLRRLADVLPAAKDVDGLGTSAAPLYAADPRAPQGDSHWPPATPRSVVELLRAGGVPLAEEQALVLGAHPDTAATARLLTQAGAVVERLSEPAGAAPAQRTGASTRPPRIVVFGGPATDLVATEGPGHTDGPGGAREPRAPESGSADGLPAWLAPGNEVALVDLGYAESAPYVPDAWGQAARWWCPARGGLGPATVAVLLEQTVAAAEQAG